MAEAMFLEEEEKSEARDEDDQGEDEAEDKVYKFQGLEQTKEKRQVAACSCQTKLSL